ncbi:hypothetical protein GGF46_001158 [Coemansia sp. RSA 552]|nr:hypothetical protein GGF46_001158 [Coemansia sp. RSA 552]
MEDAHVPDVWQQLREYRLGEPLTGLLEHIGALPRRHDADPGSVSGPHIQAPEGIQLLGLFASRYFLFGAFTGFVLSRIHVLVHRQRVRPLGIAARVALYLPALLLLVQALAQLSTALSTQASLAKPWMPDAIGGLASIAQRWGVGGSKGPSGALWLTYVAMCIFGCVEVFVARLVGSPCAPYDHVGELIERTSLFYFYGGSVRVQEMALVGIVEKLLVGTLLMVWPTGWRWRLLPTGIDNALLLHHFAFSMYNHTGPGAMYPLVHMLAMALLIAALVIVLVTAAVYWLARAVDRLTAPHARGAQAEAAVARYDHNGVFQGIDDDGGLDDVVDEALAPAFPDMRHEFAAEMIDMAAACLRQCSSQVRATGLARPCGAIRLPRTVTALDEYADRVAADPEPASAQSSHGSGLGVLMDDEPTALPSQQSSTAELLGALNRTRAGSAHRLTLGMWALVTALGHYALERKMGGGTTGGQSRRRRLRQAASADGRPEGKGVPGGVGDNSDGSDSSDYDFVCASDEASEASDCGSDCGSELECEAVGLVSDILESERSRDRLDGAVALMVHSLFEAGGAAAMTRTAYSMVARAQNVASANVVPFTGGEAGALAQLIQSRRQAAGHGSDDGNDSRTLCVVCWASPRCIMLRPCRCLCLCNDCRTALAVRDFDHCPCCRRTVAGYSRVYAV